MKAEATNFGDFIYYLRDADVDSVDVTDDIVADSDIVISTSTEILFNGNTLELNGHDVVVSDNVLISNAWVKANHGSDVEVTGKMGSLSFVDGSKINLNDSQMIVDHQAELVFDNCSVFSQGHHSAISVQGYGRSNDNSKVIVKNCTVNTYENPFLEVTGRGSAQIESSDISCEWSMGGISAAIELKGNHSSCELNRGRLSSNVGKISDCVNHSIVSFNDVDLICENALAAFSVDETSSASVSRGSLTLDSNSISIGDGVVSIDDDVKVDEIDEKDSSDEDVSDPDDISLESETTSHHEAVSDDIGYVVKHDDASESNNHVTDRGDNARRTVVVRRRIPMYGSPNVRNCVGHVSGPLNVVEDLSEFTRVSFKALGQGTKVVGFVKTSDLS